MEASKGMPHLIILLASEIIQVETIGSETANQITQGS